MLRAASLRLLWRFWLGILPTCGGNVVAAAPRVVEVQPTPGDLAAWSVVKVVFSEAVSGLEAGDLTANGRAASVVRGAGTTFEFEFVEPSPGAVLMSWDTGQAIRNGAGERFDDGNETARWSYRLADLRSPQVTFRQPGPGTVVSALAEIEVRFDEPVVGVAAADLTVNGRPAALVRTNSARAYTFGLPELPAGDVEVALADVEDAATPANPFAQVRWTLRLEPDAREDVVIQEIFAASGSTAGYRDEDGELQDWIELTNRGGAPVNLTGWALTDDPTEPGKWMFPPVTLAPGAYLVVLASGKDRPGGGGAPMHANFKLNDRGEYLALADAGSPRRVVDGWTNGYPDQRSTHGYGRGSAGLGYFARPTPGAPNADTTAVAGVVSTPEADREGGFATNTVRVTLTCATPEARVYYTTDGSVPTVATGTPYAGPLDLAPSGGVGVVVLRVAAFRDGWLSSPVATHSYLFDEAILRQAARPVGFPSTWRDAAGKTTVPADYEMDPDVVGSSRYAERARAALRSVPSLSIVTAPGALFESATGIYANPERTGVAWERACSVEFVDPVEGRRRQIDAGVRIQGGTSRSATKAHKHSLRLLFKGAYGARSLDWRFFPDSPVDRFDTLVLDAFLNLVWIHPEAAQREVGQYVRDQVVADWSNAMGRPGFHGRYHHVYLNGLYWGLFDIHERPDDGFASAYLGGAKEEWDVLKDTTSFSIIEGTDTAWRAMLSLVPGARDTASGLERLGRELDLPAFADYLLLNFYAGNTDWPHHNWYVARRRIEGARWKFFSWDAEHVFKGLEDNRTVVKDAETPGGIWDVLRQNPEFRRLFADRVQRHFQGDGIFAVDAARPAWDPAHPERNRPAAAYVRRIAEIDPAIVLESARWGDDRREPPYTRDGEWAATLNQLLTTYFPRRTAVVLQQFRDAGVLSSVAAPTFDPAGGLVVRGTALTLTATESEIFYTLDDRDPREAGTGAVVSGAIRYGEPIAVEHAVRVRARARRGTEWSALAETEFRLPAEDSPVVIAEIGGAPEAGDAYEFIELWNRGVAAVAIGGFSFEGVTAVLPADTVVESGKRVVVASDLNPAGFKARFPGVPVVAWFRGSLANRGERLVLRDRDGALVTALRYRVGDAWPVITGGHSLELVRPEFDFSDPLAWRASPEPGGTPGWGPVEVEPPAGLRLSEVRSGGTEAEVGDWIEVVNNGGSELDLADWGLSDAPDRPGRYRFPAGTRLAAGAFLVVPSRDLGFGLDREGDHALLTDRDGRIVDALSFGPFPAALTLGRGVDGAWTLGTPSPGTTNRAVELGSPSSLRLNEVVAHPLAGEEDWLEVVNLDSGRPVALAGTRFRMGDEWFRVRTPAFVAAGGFVRLPVARDVPFGGLGLGLPAEGGALGWDDPMEAAVDSVTWPALGENRSLGRRPDGTGPFVMLEEPSPGISNLPPPRWGPVREVAPGVVELTLTGPAPARLIVEQSTDLQSWQPVRDEPFTGQWSERWPVGDGGLRFFRARLGALAGASGVH